MNTKVYINVAVMGNVNSVLNDLLTRVEESGLKDYTNEIYAIVNGDINQIDKSRKWVKWIHASTSVSGQEFPTLKTIWDSSKSEEPFRVLYLHTKGVSRDNQNVKDWVDLLSYFNINKWSERISELNNNDCTGINYGGNPEDINSHPAYWGYGKAPMHYSGNFWWSNSEHISKLPDPLVWIPDNDLTRWRVMNEMWLCQIPTGKYHCAYSSGVDHYVTPYPKEIYEIK